MATNLLLEGDDLEALLIKAHSQGGPSARIVRADKYRHGGLWGFFARERFEVAVEIPEISHGAPEGSAFFVPATADAASPAEPLGQAGPPASAAPAEPVPAAAVAPYRPSPTRVAAAERLVDHLEDYLAEQPTLLPSRAEPLPRAAASPVRTAAPAEPPAPTAFAADALLGMADRVSAAERAATHVVRARARYASTEPRPHTEIDLPAAEPESPASVGELVGAGRTGGAMTRQAPAVASARQTAPTAASSPTTPITSSTVASHQAASGALATADDAPGFDARSVTDAVGGVPHEAALTPARPSTTRPEFTALLDTLRDGSRPARSPRPSNPSNPANPSNPPNPANPSSPADARPDRDDPGVTAPLDLRIDTHDPATPATSAPGSTRTAAARAARIPVQGGSGAAEPDDDDVPEVGVRQSDPRTAADRRVLRALGVPAAWTRRLRPGDRFAEVMRMLERMPEEDIDAATTVVAVVGPAESVRLEAHRTALDLAVGGEPRPVVVVPASVGTERAAAVARALRSGPVVLAVETHGPTGGTTGPTGTANDPADVDASLVLDTLTTVQAGAVIAVVDATVPLERTQRWLDALGQVDALVLDGVTEVADPAAVLQLGLPVVRLDGIPVDRVTWTAVLCAQIVAAERATAGEH